MIQLSDLSEGQRDELKAEWLKSIEKINNQVAAGAEMSGYDDACEHIEPGFRELVDAIGVDIDSFDGDGAPAYLLSVALSRIAASLKKSGVRFVDDEEEGDWKAVIDNTERS